MKKILLLLIFLIVPANADLVTVSGKHKHIGDYSPIDSCNIAIEKAKKKAMMQTLGQTISTDVISNCSEVDGEYNCERNQFSLFRLNGDITSWEEDKSKRSEGKEIGSAIRYCEVFITANVVPVKQNLDPTFHFNVKFNEKTFRSGEILEIDITPSKKMYMSIFQWLPYRGKKFNKVTKIFPNKQFNKTVNNLIIDNISLRYEIYFPENIKKEKVTEYLVFIASESQIPWLPGYTEIEGLISQSHKSKILMEKHTSAYIIIK